MYKYNKDTLKKELTIEQIYELLFELKAEPVIKDHGIVCKTICHNHDPAEASHKLYYYSNTQLFHCYTGCGDASFDIYELLVKVKNNAGDSNFNLTKAVNFIANYFGYSSEIFDFEQQETLKDWKIINTFKKKDKKDTLNFSPKLKIYNKKILSYFPQPHILDWEKEGISFSVIKSRSIKYDPYNEGVIIPHHDINNNLIGIRERTLIKENEIYGKYRPAYLNGVLYNHPLGYNLYNLNNSKNAIKIFQKAILYEGEKSCLKYASYFGEESDISVACCGSNLINYQIQLLLSLGVKEIVIAFDKQFQATHDLEWEKWTTKLKTFYNRFGSYTTISYMFDKFGLLEYKDSPIDQGKDIFLELFKKRIILT